MNVNLAFLSYVALGPDEVIGHQAKEFNLGLEIEPNRFGLADKTIDDGNLRNFEKELTLRSGEHRTVFTTVASIHVQDTDAILYTFIDITDRVQAEMEIYRLNVERKTIEHKERHRIARMLHDDLQQRLFAIKIHLDHLEQALQNDNLEAAKVEFVGPTEWLEGAISLTRQLSADLSPPNFREENLVEAIVSLSSQMKDKYGLDVELQAADFEIKFEDALQVTLLQTVSELLFNIVKHSGSLKAFVTLKQVSKDLVHITVRDEGKGFDAKSIIIEKNHGRELRSVQQDLKLFGGHLEVDSRQDRGTRMIVSIPIPGSQTGS